MVEAYVENEKKHHDMMVTQSYLTAYLHRVKKMPKLQTMLIQKPKEQSPEEMLQKIKALNAQMGGDVY